MGNTSKRYPTEFQERAVRLVAEQQGQGDSCVPNFHSRRK